MSQLVESQAALTLKRRRHRQSFSNPLRKGGILIGGVSSFVHQRKLLQLREGTAGVEPVQIVQVIGNRSAQENFPRGGASGFILACSQMLVVQLVVSVL